MDNIKYQDAKEFIINHEGRDLSNISEYRLKAIEYMEQYCGAASDPKYNFVYNKKYGDYNPQGGDCDNFASQTLFETGRFKKNSTWNHNKNGATKAWLNADGFSRYLLSSGRGSLITKGTYDKVYKSLTSYCLEYCCYEKVVELLMFQWLVVQTQRDTLW